MGLEPPGSSPEQAAPSVPALSSEGSRSRAAAMHIPESLQDLADSEAVQFLKRPKTIMRLLAAVRRPWQGPLAPLAALWHPWRPAGTPGDGTGVLDTQTQRGAEQGSIAKGADS